MTPLPRTVSAALVALALVGGPALVPVPSPAAPRATVDAAGGDSWRPPLDGALRVVHGFAPPAQRWLAGHRGVDLAAAEGATVRAAGDGVVGYAGSLAGVPVVTVVHGGLRTTYQPVRAVVRVGQRLTAGAALGVLALAGGHCRPSACLHWGLLRGSAYLDPLSLVRRGPPRLLPLDGRPATRPRVLAPAPEPAPERAPEPTSEPTSVPAATAALLASLSRSAAGLTGW